MTARPRSGEAPDSCAAALVARGLDPAELGAKRALFDVVFDAFGGVAEPPQPPPHVWWVPGRLEVFGKHTDYAGGRTLVCAVPRGFAVAAGPRRDGRVQVIDARSGDCVTLQPSAAAGPLAEWGHYADVVVRRLARNFPGMAIGADLVFASDLPRAAGMSSSSALMVGLATALVRVAEIEGRTEWRTNIHGTLDAAGYYACIENGHTFGTLEGDAGVGTHGGSEDHAAILAAAPGQLSAFQFVPMRQIGSVAMPDRWRFVLAPSGITAEKTGTAREAYNRLALGAQVLLELWNAGEKRGQAASLAASLEWGPADRLRDSMRRSPPAGWPADALEKRLEHFIREDARVPEALDAFRAADAARLTALSEQSQADAETLLGNQIPETIALARSARTLGAFAACSFGAGFGGSVWALVDRAAADELARRWHPGAFVAAPAPALTELSRDAITARP